METSTAAQAATLPCLEAHVRTRYPNARKYGFTDAYSLSESDAQTGAMSAAQLAANTARMKQEILSSGPISVTMLVYGDFMQYRDGVYHSNGRGGIVGGHAISLVGWGPTYWIAKNSWGRAWGQQGYWLHAFGDPYSLLEANAVAGRPNLNLPVVQAMRGAGACPSTPAPTDPRPAAEELEDLIRR